MEQLTELFEGRGELVLAKRSTDTTAGCRVNIKLDNELGSGRCIRRLIVGLVLYEWK